MTLRLVGVERPRERTVVVEPYPDGTLRGILHDGDRFLGHVFAWRPDDSALRIEIARKLLQGAEAYRWSAKVYQPCDDTGETPHCAPEWDRVPDRGTIRHDLGG